MLKGLTKPPKRKIKALASLSSLPELWSQPSTWSIRRGLIVGGGFAALIFLFLSKNKGITATLPSSNQIWRSGDVNTSPGEHMALSIDQDLRIPIRVRRWASAAVSAAQESAPAAIGKEQWARILLSLFDHESNGKVDAVGDGGKAFGLGQINVRFWPDFAALPLAQKFDPFINAKFSSQILRKAFDLWIKTLPVDQALFASLAAYNSGSGNVAKALKAGRSADYYTTKTKGVGYAADVIARYSGTGGEIAVNVA